jgi:2-methylisocitrate lyase-like PEP mutase family enzyme
MLYAPGVSKPEDIKAIVKAVAPKPINVLIIRPDMTAKGLEQLGVGRHIDPIRRSRSSSTQ